MKMMSPELFKEYSLNPLATDEKIRKILDLPENKYYTVSMDGPNIGAVYITKLSREVKTKKISKSDAK